MGMDFAAISYTYPKLQCTPLSNGTRQPFAARTLSMLTRHKKIRTEKESAKAANDYSKDGARGVTSNDEDYPELEHTVRRTFSRAWLTLFMVVGGDANNLGCVETHSYRPNSLSDEMLDGCCAARWARRRSHSNMPLIEPGEHRVCYCRDGKRHPFFVYMLRINSLGTERGVVCPPKIGVSRHPHKRALEQNRTPGMAAGDKNTQRGSPYWEAVLFIGPFDRGARNFACRWMDQSRTVKRRLVYGAKMAQAQNKRVYSNEPSQLLKLMCELPVSVPMRK